MPINIGDNEIDNSIDRKIIPTIELAKQVSLLSSPSTLLNGLSYYWNFNSLVSSNWYAPTVGSPYFYVNNPWSNQNGILGNSFYAGSPSSRTQAITTNNGSSTPLDIPPLPFNNYLSPSALTINMWVNIGGSAGVGSVIFGKRRDSSTELAYTIRLASSTTLSFSDRLGSFQNFLENPSSIIYASFSDYRDLRGTGEWIMVTLYTDQGGSIALILNGNPSGMIQDGSEVGSMNTMLDTYTAPLILCTQGVVGVTNASDIKIDEIGIWNRQLSLNELQTLYNNGLGKAYPF